MNIFLTGAGLAIASLGTLAIQMMVDSWVLNGRLHPYWLIPPLIGFFLGFAMVLASVALWLAQFLP